MAKSLPKGLNQLSGKHVLVDKANTVVIVSAAIAAAIVVFSIFASMALIKKINYQNKVIGLKNSANSQLEKNIAAKDQLVTAYAAFDSATESVIGTADKNSKIVLDALPSKYDFPALATSLDSIITNAGLSVGSITGTDEEVSAQQSSISPQPIAIPFEISAQGDYAAAQRLINDLQRSIRPFKITSVQFSVGEDGIINVAIKGESTYQPEKETGIVEHEVDKSGKFIIKDAQKQSSATTTGGNK